MNVTIYCCKRGVKHRIKDVLHSTQSITVDEMETDLNTYSFLTNAKKKGEKGRYGKQEMWCHFRNINHRQSDLEGL